MAGKSRDPARSRLLPGGAATEPGVFLGSAELSVVAVSAPVSLRQWQVISVITHDNMVADLIPTYF
jgi:hypothetical protein